MAWASAGRRSEVAALDRSDVTGHPVDGLHLQIRVSKTDPHAAGQVVAIPFGSQLSLDDVRRALSDPEMQAAPDMKSVGRPARAAQRHDVELLPHARGDPGVEADRMIIGYTNPVLGRRVTAKEACSLAGIVADQMGASRTLLVHAIWRLESGRPVFLDLDYVAAS